MHKAEDLLEIQRRTHTNLKALLQHCDQFSSEELNREIGGFGYPTVRLQFHHEISCEQYWIGVLQGRMEVDEDDPKYPTIESLENYRQEIFQSTANYIQSLSVEELNTARPMITWGNKEKILIPAHVFLRTQTHYYHHQGQIAAMCRLLGKPIPPGLDYPITQ